MAARDIFARIRDVVAVEAYQRAKVVIIGFGSVTSPVALRLAQHGVGHLVLIDPDRLDWTNVARHLLGANWVGEPKVLAGKAVIEEHVPGTTVAAIPERFGVELGADFLDAIFADADLVICATDDLEANATANRFCLGYDVPGIFATVDAETGRGEIVAVLGRGAAPCYECYIHWRRVTHENRRGVPMALATMQPTHGFLERLALGLLDRSSTFFSDIFAIRPAADRIDPGHPATVFWVARPEAPSEGAFAEGSWRPQWADFHPDCPACGSHAIPQTGPPAAPPRAGPGSVPARPSARTATWGGPATWIVCGLFLLFGIKGCSDVLDGSSGSSASPRADATAVAASPTPAHSASDALVGDWTGRGRDKDTGRPGIGFGPVRFRLLLSVDTTGSEGDVIGRYRYTFGNQVNSPSEPCSGTLKLVRREGDSYVVRERDDGRGADECFESPVDRYTVHGDTLRLKQVTRLDDGGIDTVTASLTRQSDCVSINPTC